MNGPAGQPKPHLPGAPYWLVVRDATGRNPRQLDVFSFDFEGERLMPLFGDGDQAEMFACSVTPGLPGATGWKPRLSSSGEVISLLSSDTLGAGVKRVALDPPPEVIGGAELHLISMSREMFLEDLIGRGRGWFDDEGRRKGRWKAASFEEASMNDGKEESGALR